MEGQSQLKEKVEDIETELGDINLNIQRPKNFSLQRRRNVYYFSDNSAKGILKRVPVVNGSYEINESKTVSEKSDSEKLRDEVSSDVASNDPGSSKCDKNSTAGKSDDSYETVHNEQGKVTTTRTKFQLQGLKNLTILKTHKDSPKKKSYIKTPLNIIDQDQKGESFYKPLKEFKEKKHQTDAGPTDFQNVKECVSDEKKEAERPLNDSFDVSMKVHITEL